MFEKQSFRYIPQDQSPKSRKFGILPVILFVLVGNAIGVGFFLANIFALHQWEWLLFVPFMLVWILGWNYSLFAWLVRQATIELTGDDVALLLVDRWRIRIPAKALGGALVERFDEPHRWVHKRPVGYHMTCYYIQSPHLPLYFAWIGRWIHSSLKGRGFIITSHHERYEEFLDYLRSRQATFSNVSIAPDKYLRLVM